MDCLLFEDQVFFACIATPCGKDFFVSSLCMVVEVLSVLFNQTTKMIVPNQIILGNGMCYIDKSSGDVKIVHIVLGVTQNLLLVAQLVEKQFDMLFPNDGRKVTHTKNNV